METRTTSSAAVSEVLNVDNYLVWSVQVKTYLIAQDLWDIVEATVESPEQEDDDSVEATEESSEQEDDDIVEVTDESPEQEDDDIVEATDECPIQEDDEVAVKDWSKKNAMALHVIQISCPQRICHVISLITSAKIAWKTLKLICTIPKSDYSVPEEKEERYEAWSNRMNKILRKHHLRKIVETTIKPTTPKWSKKNALALYLIRESCGTNRFTLIEKISTAKVAWEVIEFNSDSDMIDLDEVDEYNDWSLRMKTELKREQLWDIVEGTDEPPEAENDDDATFMAWSKKNDTALKVIRDSCINAMEYAIRKISSAKIAWDTLAGICALPETAFEFLANDGNNYLDWSLQVKAILTDRQLWDIVEGTGDPPKVEKNDMALGLIRYSYFWFQIWLSYKHGIDKLGSITSAKILWDALAAICALPKNILTDKKSIATTIERLESIPNVIKRLDDVDNYEDWSSQVKTYLMDLQLWDIVKGTNEPPKAKKNDPAFMAWSEKNALAFRVIMFSCGYRLRFAIWWITSAKFAWYTLAEICIIPKSRYIVHEEYDYVAWSVRMEAYLQSNHLWDIVEAATEPPKPKDDENAFNAWSKKNAIALYLIWESSDAFFSFKKSTRTAQIAWDTLAEFGKSGGIRSELRKYKSFRQNLRDGYWRGANQFIRSNPEAESAIIANTGSTALHIAILAGHLHIVEKLVNMLPTDKLLEIKDKDGNTFLGYCALVGTKQMAECIVKKCPSLPGIGNGPKALVPVVMAVRPSSNSKAMARYLLRQTDLKILSPGKGRNGATFVTRCIYSKAFDMAFDALEKFPTLVTALDIENESPVLALASMSFAYTSGNQLRFWTQRISNCIPNPPVDDNNQIPVSIQDRNMAVGTATRGEQRVTSTDPIDRRRSSRFTFATGRCWRSEREENLEVGAVQSPELNRTDTSQGSVWNLLKFLDINQIYESKRLHQESKKLLHRMCEVLTGLNFQQLENGKVIEAIIIAVKQGRVEFVTEILEAFPELAWSVEKSTGRNIFMLAVLYRQDEIFRFLCKSPANFSILALGDHDRNTILHIAAMFEPSARSNTVPGAAFLMQREVQWYKKVESFAHLFMLEYTNTKGKKPRELFTESHKELVEEGEKWMKETASSCTVVAALIVTIMFAAAITVPGGNEQDLGLPTFLNEKVFMVFIISDALSMLSASTSLLMFLGILTSRYAEEDFLKSLPKKMIVGLSTLILSIATMMITFCASLFIILPGKSRLVIPIICLASVPVTLFAWMQFHLLIDMVKSTYAPIILDKKAKFGS